MKKNRKAIIITLIIMMFFSIFSVVGYYWYRNHYYITTDDAKITGDLVKICPQTTGKIVDFFVDEGSEVEKDQIVGRIEAPNLPEQSIEQTIIRSPIKGVVVKKNVTVGEIISAGQIMAYVTNPQNFYISANIEETDMIHLKVGQKVDIKADLYPQLKIIGHVGSIGKASNSVFSLFPTGTGGTFTKVVQKIPVHIDFKSDTADFINGTNVSVKIHIR